MRIIYNQIADMILIFFPIYVLFNIPTNIALIYLLGYLLSYLLNGGLKYISRSLYKSKYRKIICRPNQKCNKNTYVGDIGMPSGHTQVIAFSAGFLASTPLNNSAFVFSIIMPLLRILGKKHTILQTIIGYVIGYFSGIFFYIIRD